LPLEFGYLLVFLEHLQTLLTGEGNRFIEEFVEIKVVFGEEVHCSCVETKPHQVVIESNGKDIEVKGRGDDPEVNWESTCLSLVGRERLRVQTEGV
jgi:hypothetical protein